MKIYHYTECFSAGVMSALSSLAKAQRYSNFEVEIVYCSREFTPPRDELNNLFSGVVLTHLGYSSPKSLFFMAKHFLKTVKLSDEFIIHSHSSWAGFVTRSINFFIKHKRLYFTPHSFAYLRRDINFIPKLIFRLIELCLGRFSASTIIASSKREYQEAIMLGSNSNILGGNYIDDPLEKAHLIKKIPSVDEFEIATVGRITNAKNPERFIRVAKNCSQGIKISWIGGGDISNTNLMLKNNISISGWLSAEETLLKISKLDCLLITSDWEALPMVAIEAMAFSIPIVSWNYDGVLDIIEDGINGYICRDEKSMIDKIEYLAKNYDHRIKMGESARKIFLTNFDSKILKQNWKQFYQFNNYD